MLIAKIIMVVSFIGIFGLINKAWKVGQKTNTDDLGPTMFFGILGLGCGLIFIISGLFLFFAA